jgi:hypothetical protein
MTESSSTVRGISDYRAVGGVFSCRETERLPRDDPWSLVGCIHVLLLATKDVAHFHFDFNVSQFLIGRQNASGFDQNQELNLAFSHFIYKGLQITGEFYGETQLNQTTPAFASSLWALTYTIIPRLVIDGGFEHSLTSGGPHVHAFAGATYSITNLYARWRRRRSSTPADR